MADVVCGGGLRYSELELGCDLVGSSSRRAGRPGLARMCILPVVPGFVVTACLEAAGSLAALDHSTRPSDLLCRRAQHNVSVGLQAANLEQRPRAEIFPNRLNPASPVNNCGEASASPDRRAHRERVPR